MGLPGRWWLILLDGFWLGSWWWKGSSGSGKAGSKRWMLCLGAGGLNSWLEVCEWEGDWLEARLDGDLRALWVTPGVSKHGWSRKGFKAEDSSQKTRAAALWLVKISLLFKNALDLELSISLLGEIRMKGLDYFLAPIQPGDMYGWCLGELLLLFKF